MWWLERFHMTPRPPYWWFKLMKRRPCWCSTWVLYVKLELNQPLSHVKAVVWSNKFAQLLATWVKTLYWANFFKLKINPDPLSKIPKKTEASLFSFYLWDWVEDLSLSVFLASEIITNNTVVSTAAPRLVLCPLLLHFAPFGRYYSREL